MTFKPPKKYCLLLLHATVLTINILKIIGYSPMIAQIKAQSYSYKYFEDLSQQNVFFWGYKSPNMLKNVVFDENRPFSKVH